ncbi:BrnA antitoxin family protein [Methylobacterium sp. HMF5984]|uniref:BrnA antitoxin family protein n=1 Tax=Methylobacterium sp. HMF5984 TaxID=3367370 RepID=UPI003854606B
MIVSDRKTDAPAFSQADWDEVSDNPDLTDVELAALRPARELPPDIYAALPRNRGGRPRAASPKVQLTLRIDRRVLDAYKATGPGWQTRMHDVLARIVDDPGAGPHVEADTAREAGIYRRTGSDRGVAVAAGQPFPPSQDAESGPSGRKKA